MTPSNGPHDAATNLPALRDVLAEIGLTPKRSLGQNFLLDLNLTRRIARAAGPLPGKTIVEIGPGPGGLTRALLQEGASHVIVIERDDRCLPALESISAAYPGCLTIHGDNALKIDETTLLDHLTTTPNQPTEIVANLPYNIGTALLIKWLRISPWVPWYQRMTLLFQREVAQRIVAVPGTKDYGRLSILAQWRTRPTMLFDIAPQAFTPPPKVTSSLVQLEVLPEPRFPAELILLEQVTAAAFGQRRKMLRQSLKSLGVPVDALLSAAKIDETLRPEALDVEAFCALARALETLRST